MTRVRSAGRRSKLRLRLVVQAMSRRAEPSVFAGRLDAAALEDRGYKRCAFCEGLLPLNVSRCRRRRCPGYAATWARDTMRKIRENLRTYGGLACMCTL